MRASWPWIALVWSAVVGAPVARAEEPVRVVVVAFEGPGAARVRREVVRALRAHVELVPRRRLERVARSRALALDVPSDLAASAAELDVDAIVEGTVSQEPGAVRVTLAVVGTEGAVVVEERMTAHNPARLRRTVRVQAWRRLGDALTSTGRDDPSPVETASPPPASDPPAETAVEPAENLATRGRVLAGHRFTPLAHVRSPFTGTEIGMHTGASFTRIERLALGNQVPTPDGVAAVTLGADLQVGLVDWLAIRARAWGLGALATDARIEETSGAALGWLFEAGVVVSAPLGPARVGVSADLGHGEEHALRPIAEIAAEYELTGEVDAFAETPRLSFGARAHAAVGLHPALGVLGWAGLRPADPVALVGATEAGPTAGALVSLDLAAASVVPLALSTSYEWWSGGGPTHRVGAGLAYSGHEHVSVGLEGALVEASQGELSRVTWTGRLHTRVYW